MKVGRTVETKGDDLVFLGLHVFVSFACALGESALPFAGSADRGGSALPDVARSSPSSEKRVSLPIDAFDMRMEQALTNHP